MSINTIRNSGGNGPTAIKERFKMFFNFLSSTTTKDNVQNNLFTSQSGTPSSSYTINNSGTCYFQFIHNTGVPYSYNCKVYHNSTLIFDSTVSSTFKVYNSTFSVNSGDTISYTCTQDSSHSGLIDILIL